MKEKGKGVIINTSSVAGAHAHHGPVGYVTSKRYALNGLTKSMAWELGPEIRANAILPGAIVTAMLNSIGGEDAVPLGRRFSTKEGWPTRRNSQSCSFPS